MDYRVHTTMYKEHNGSILYASLKLNKVKENQRKLTKQAYNIAHSFMFITLASLLGLIGTLGYFVAYQTDIVLMLLITFGITGSVGALMWHKIDQIANELFYACSENEGKHELLKKRTAELDHIAKCAREYQQEMHEYKSELDRIKQNA